ncbi:hypothetical protein GXW82_09880 [Streptacidiphilus sp. 4-A2]|nr:hypothetical protein [Streptacidiphilus sp. 4-A2]
MAEGLDQARVARNFDRRLALHSPETALRPSWPGCAGACPRVVGAEAKALDLLGGSPVRLQRFGVLCPECCGSPHGGQPGADGYFRPRPFRRTNSDS